MAQLSANSEYNATVKRGFILEYIDKMTYSKFANRLKEIQSEKPGIEKQYKFAKYLDISTSFMSDMLRGEKLPSMDLAIEIADKFNVSVDWLMRGIGSKYIQIEINHDNCLNLSKLTSENKMLVELLYLNLLKGQPAENKQVEPIQNQQSKDIREGKKLFSDMLEKSCEK